MSNPKVGEEAHRLSTGNRNTTLHSKANPRQNATKMILGARGSRDEPALVDNSKTVDIKWGRVTHSFMVTSLSAHTVEA